MKSREEIERDVDAEIEADRLSLEKGLAAGADVLLQFVPREMLGGCDPLDVVREVYREIVGVEAKDKLPRLLKKAQEISSEMLR